MSQLSTETIAPPQPPARQVMAEGVVSRQAHEVQAAMVIAKKFPRDETASFHRIMAACKRKALAESALYAYPKGGQVITGPSIRLAEAMAQAWGNLSFGIVELEQRNGESTALSYCWDLETNVRHEKVFTVRHFRHTRRGDYQLTDPREVYEIVANQGARRLRACILGVIPGDVQDAAIAECERTLAGGNTEPLVDRVRKMVGVFAELGISQLMLETRLGHKIDATIAAELVGLGKIYRTIVDGMAKREDFFEIPGQPCGEAGNTPLDKLKQAAHGEVSDSTSPEPNEDKIKAVAANIEGFIQISTTKQALEDGPGRQLTRHKELLGGEEHDRLMKLWRERYEQLPNAAPEKKGRRQEGQP